MNGKDLMLAILFIIISIIAGFNIMKTLNPIKNNTENHPNFSIPEEYKLIDKSTAIQGYYNSKTNTLHIEFDNSIQFKWEGLDKDIPQDGIRELQLTTNENTVYLNPVDE